ncbi:MAG: polyprenyl synthetase family protein [Acidobacteria bacterium]|nr:polyprenyl synthetase family protein [Acidobacteriota bacterium]MDW7984208.1 polyprenyl synthetase family protein [Acidobacteriota bacterium]
MDIERVKSYIRDLPGVADWPEMGRLLDRSAERLAATWRLPGLVCRALGADEVQAVPGAAAIACVHISIILVDDILDQDPRGIYQEMGEGAAANLALAFQASAFRCLERAPVEAERRTTLLAALAETVFRTAVGQHLDARCWGDEADYWRVLRTKSTPLYGAAFYFGALLAGAASTVADSLRQLGVLMGEAVQLYDDLMDVFQEAALPDWKRKWNNLAILYALTAEHAERDRFRVLLDQIDDPAALQEAQAILVRSGAVSYCAYHLFQRQQAARELLKQIPLADTEALTDAFVHQFEPLVRLFQTLGLEVPRRLLGNP